MRDSQEEYRPLEKLFGTLIPGNAFGETALSIPLQESKPKFYNAIALTDCHYLYIEKLDFDNRVKESEKKALQEKTAFLKSIPEFRAGLARNKLNTLCHNMTPLSCIKDQRLHKEGDPCKFIHLVRSGEVKLCVKAEQRQQHVVTIVSTGHLIGLEDIVIGETPVHTTSAVVTNAAELYKIDKDQFYSTLKQTQTWQELVRKSKENVSAYHKSIKLMK